MRALAALVFVALPAMGCSSSPDVVASDDSNLYFTDPLVRNCKPGRYRGSFSTVSEDGGSTFDLWGSIEFSLVLSPQGEFLELESGASLTGKSESPIAGGTITADLNEVGSCNDGQINTLLENGVYTASGLTLTFSGTSSGTYHSDHGEFNGQWTAHLTDSPQNVFGGSWGAFWVGP